MSTPNQPTAAALADINARIATIRANLRALTEQAAARSGAADEDLAADRIERLETKLAELVALRDGAGPGAV